MTEKLLVTSALPYANGPLHIGQIAGAYLPADIYVRYKRLMGSDVVYICGSDEHGVPITITAERNNLTPREVVDFYHKNIQEDFKDLWIEFDNYSRTSLPIHYEKSQEFFTRIYKKGNIVKKTTRQLYCKTCKMFLPDRYVEGICPHCENKGARGDQCEACGRWIDPLTLKEPTCQICKTTPEVKETTHYFLQLSKYQDRLKEYLEVNTHWRENVRKFCLKWLDEGLEERAITRDIDWGIPVPLEEAEGKVLYVWFEAPIGYISSTMEWAKRQGDDKLWERYWKDPESRIIHFIGKDNIVFHALVWPAILMGQDGYNLPYEIPANEFLNIEGKKLSTSRNWAIWVGEVLKSFDPDLLRYYLTLNLPETRDTDFSWGDFQERCNSELIDAFGNLIYRSLSFIDNYFEGVIPELGQLDELDEKILEEIKSAPEEVGGELERFRMRGALKKMMKLVRAGNKYYNDKEPWTTRGEDIDKCKTTLNITARLLSVLTVLAEPFVPKIAEGLKGMLNLRDHINGFNWYDIHNLEIPEKTKLGEVYVPYDKIEDEDVEREREKLGKPIDIGLDIKKEGVKIMDNITFDEFKRLDLRVATIKDAEMVEGADKLLKLVLDLGDTESVAVAGIAEFYKPEDLVGMKVAYLYNLEPRTVFGVKSQGMILAGTKYDGDELSDVVLLTLDRDIPDGSVIS